MASAPLSNPTIVAAVETAAREFVSVQHWGGSSFVSLPLFGPDGSPITVRVTQDIGGFRVDDGCFAYQDLMRVGAERSFHRTANKFAEKEGLGVADQAIFTTAGPDDLARAISDVAFASWQTLDQIHARLEEADEAEIEEGLRERLKALFGSRLDQKQTIVGSSTTEWKVSAILHVEGKLAIFQAVGDHANSIYRVSAAFHDLMQLPVPPTLISVVRDRIGLGAKLGILAQAGRVIEEDQPDAVFLRAAA